MFYIGNHVIRVLTDHGQTGHAARMGQQILDTDF